MIDIDFGALATLFAFMLASVGLIGLIVIITLAENPRAEGSKGSFDMRLQAVFGIGKGLLGIDGYFDGVVAVVGLDFWAQRCPFGQANGRDGRP